MNERECLQWESTLLILNERRYLIGIITAIKTIKDRRPTVAGTKLSLPIFNYQFLKDFNEQTPLSADGN